jgi:outer membrane protein assembly factor BamB
MPRIKMIVYSILASLMLACCKEPTNTTPPPARKQLEVKWKTLLVPSANSTLRTIAMTPILYNGEVIFNSEYTLNGIEAPVVFLDTADGTIRRTWNDHSGGPYNRNTVAFSGIHLIFGEQRKVDCLNLLSASTAWKSSVNISYPMLHEHKGYLYRAIEFNPIGNQYNSCALMRTAVSSLAWDTVYSFTATDDYKPSFTGYGSGTLANGDEVVVWKSWSRKLNTQQHRAEIFAYNLTADSLMWRNSEFLDHANTIPLQVENGVVYGLIRTSAFAIDLATGNTLWRRDFNSINGDVQFAALPFHLDGNYMLVQSQNVDKLYYLNKITGKLIREIDVPYRYDRFAYFEGNLYSAGLGIGIINIASGENLLADYDQSMFESWNSGITIDPDRRVFYCHDGEYAYCIKIPDL